MPIQALSYTLLLYMEPHCVQGVQLKWFGNREWQQVEEEDEKTNL